MTETESLPEADIPTVVSSEMGCRLGEHKTFSLPDGSTFTATIVGILAEPTQYLFPTGSASPQFFSADFIISTRPGIILDGGCKPLQQNSAIQLNTEDARNLFLFVKEGQTASSINEATHTWNRYGEITTMDALLSTYNEKEYDILSSGLMTFFVFFSLAFTGVVSHNVIQSMKNQYTYVVYYLLGLSWRKVAVIECIRIGFLLLCMGGLIALAAKFDLLMMSWMSPSRVGLFYAILFLYLLLLFVMVSLFFIRQFVTMDLSVSLKNLQHGE